MVAVDSDDEEERKHLLSQTNSPSKVQTIEELERFAWQEDMEESNKLRLGPAEQQFLAMAGKEQEQDCLKVVSSILSQLDTENNSVEGGEDGEPHHRLVVDVHQGVARAEQGRLSSERVSRCYSESDRQREAQTDQLHNCDRIETVGEERARHMSESAAGPQHWTVGRRKRAATLGSEVRVVRASGEPSLLKQLRSSDSLQETGLQTGLQDNSQDSFDGLDLGDDPKNSLESFQFPPHPLVTELYNCYTSTRPGCMSHSSSTSSMPICRICQLPSLEPHNSLISPCRCLGSIRYVHNPCLAKWLEVCSKKTGDPPVCELCQYQYIRHKKFVISNWRVPSISSRDSVLHLIFLLSILIMIICSVATILTFKQSADTLPKVGPDTELSTSELLTLSCGVLFFLSFFVAMYVEVKAEYTIYQLICKFFQMNHEWTILEYDRTRDRDKTEENREKAGFP